MADRILTLPAGSRAMVLAPVVKDRKGEHVQALEDARSGGFVRARVDGRVLSLDDEIALAKTKRHTIDIVVDRVILPAADDAEARRSLAGRLAEVGGAIAGVGRGHAARRGDAGGRGRRSRRRPGLLGSAGLPGQT